MTFEQARMRLVEDLCASGANVAAMLRHAEAVLCEDGKTVMLYAPFGAGEWTFASFDLAGPVERIDTDAIERALRHAVN
jgi:hypothetical protein